MPDRTLECRPIEPARKTPRARVALIGIAVLLAVLIGHNAILIYLMANSYQPVVFAIIYGPICNIVLLVASLTSAIIVKKCCGTSTAAWVFILLSIALPAFAVGIDILLMKPLGLTGC